MAFSPWPPSVCIMAFTLALVLGALHWSVGWASQALFLQDPAEEELPSHTDCFLLLQVHKALSSVGLFCLQFNFPVTLPVPFAPPSQLPQILFRIQVPICYLPCHHPHLNYSQFLAQSKIQGLEASDHFHFALFISPVPSTMSIHLPVLCSTDQNICMPTMCQILGAQ